MSRLFKRLGAVGGALLLLNEIRGVVMVAMMLNGWAQSAHAHPQFDAVAKLISCGLAC